MEKFVWLKTVDEEKNQNLLFVKEEFTEKRVVIKIRVACADYYKIIVNGKTESWGPSRTAKGYAAINECKLFLEKGKNSIAVWATSYGVACYSNVKQAPYFALEAEIDGKKITQDDFICVKFSNRLKNVQRYSFQRGFSEMYRFDKPFTETIESVLKNGKTEETRAVMPPKTLQPYFKLSRPIFCVTGKRVGAGTFTYNPALRDWTDRSIYQVGNHFEGFCKDELIECMTEKICRFDYRERTDDRRADKITALHGGEYAVYDLGANKSGFIATKIKVSEPAEIYVCFDEMLSPETNKTVDPVRMDCCNIVKYELDRGEYDLETFDVYTAKYIQINVLSGEITVKTAAMRLLENRDAYKMKSEIADPVLQKIVVAAQNTLAQNAYDILTDCPSRERAGWLNDQYYSKQAAEIFTGETLVCKASLLAVLLDDGSGAVPEGFCPMCYPSEHIDGQYVPNCSLWFLLNACEMLKRGGFGEYNERVKDKAYKILRAISVYENANGLLEDVKGWVFIEWSKAREYTKGINFPLNMLYYKTLVTLAETYGDSDLSAKAERLGKKIEELSFNGEFFEDHRMRNEAGEAKLLGHTTEVCQYYAFFSGLATKEKYPKLYKTLSEQFGINRDETTSYSDVAKANIITGMLMRLDMLNENGEYEKALNECKDIFGIMAERSDTLWEHLRPTASCNHAIASFAAVAILRALTGLKGYDGDGPVFGNGYFGKIDCSFALPFGKKFVKVEVKNGERHIGKL